MNCAIAVLICRAALHLAFEMLGYCLVFLESSRRLTYSYFGEGVTNNFHMYFYHYAGNLFSHLHCPVSACDRQVATQVAAACATS